MWKRTVGITLLLIIIVLSWEISLVAGGSIPDEAIRIRVVANSDSPIDQWVKRQVRDAIVAKTNAWADELQHLDYATARSHIRQRLSDFEAVANDTLRHIGSPYAAKAQLEASTFPARRFGNRLYAADQYETLLITLGGGEGENWWCVLFPPLCFTDGTVVKDSYAQGAVDKNANKNVIHNPSANTANKTPNPASQQGQYKVDKPKVTPKLYIVELWRSWF